MCRPVTCRLCGKTTWAGCGQHVDQVLARVPNAERCPGHDTVEKATLRRRSLLDRVLGRP